jgi:two-component system phosphate regulon sensor histidine kinase PhoR
MTFRLHSRLVLWNVLIIGLISVILGYFLDFSLRKDIEQQIETRLLDETVLGAAYLKTDPNKPFDQQADELGRLLNLRVTIIAHDGNVLGDSEVETSQVAAMENHRLRPEVQAAVRVGTGASVRLSDTVRVQFIYVARRLDSYILRLAMPLSAVDALSRDLRAQLALAMLIALALTFGFGYVVFGLISRPLRDIASASKKLAAGDLNQRLPITGDEEIAALGTSLNSMAQNLNSRMIELLEGKQRLESILQAMRDGVMVLDQNARVILTNDSAVQMLGPTRNLFGKTPLEILRRPELENRVRAVLSGAMPQQLEITTGNGRILQANVAPVPNAAGEIDSVVTVFHDVTDIRRTETMRRDFVANVSHEFKTPLTSIRGYAETLLSGAKDDSKIAPDFLKTIERNARYLEALVSDLLTLARLEAELPATLELFPLRPVIDEQIQSRKDVIRDRGLHLTVDCPSIEVRSDRSRLSAALSNLIDNAINYNSPGGQIRVAAELQNRTLILSMTDTGVGIPSGELLRIFERFYRVDKARARDSGGTGLGLSIVKHAIESQGGTVSVTSRVGSGSTFTIRLPV